MMDEKTIILFIVGVLLGGFIVMLLWLSSPGCMTVDLFSETINGGTIHEVNVTPGILVASDGSGRTITTTGERGTPASFIDPTGARRDVVCYTSIYCVDETPCDPCDEDECQDNGERCGYWPGQSENFAAANIQTEGMDYGECCPPYDCMDGYCRPPEGCVETGDYCRTDNDCCEGECINGVCGEEGECVETGEMCGRAQDPSIATHVAYTDYGACCPPDECINNLCTPPEEEECVDYGQTCGMVQNAGTYTAVTYTDYGECCPPYECVNNKCGEEEEECQQENEGCGVISFNTGSQHIEEDLGECCPPLQCLNNLCLAGCTEAGGQCKSDSECCEGFCYDGVCANCKTSGSCTPGAGTCCEGYRCWEYECQPEETCDEEGDRCSKDSDCCDDLVCIDNHCEPETECGEEGDTCGLGVECCSGLFCTDNDECEECAGIGDFCGGYTAAGIPCCPGAFCYQEFCQEATDHRCVDQENGPDYYSQGSATGEYEGDYGTYTDYCINDNTVLDYYCTVNNEYAPIEAGMVTCPSGCSGGACN